MIFHDDYTNVPPAEIDRFVQAQELGRLVTVGADGTPHVGLYPFVGDRERFDIHLVRADEQKRRAAKKRKDAAPAGRLGRGGRRASCPA